MVALVKMEENGKKRRSIAKMPITNFDFFLTLSGTCLGQEVQHGFYYHANGVNPPTALQVASAFSDQVLPEILNVVNQTVDYNTIEVINLDDLGDFNLTAIVDGQGNVTSTSIAPPFVAYGFAYGRTTRLGRNGSKRFPGVSEEFTNHDGSSLAAPLDTAIPALVTALRTQLEILGQQAYPMIPYRIPHAPDAQHPNTWYTLENLLGVSGVQFTGLTTQNSRKR